MQQRPSMEILYRSKYDRPPEVSFILLDWGCRESFHILDYFARQTVARQRYEVMWIEYWDRRAEQIDRAFDEARRAGGPAPVDTWVVMHMPPEVYYHKHLMYNVGIALARGKIVTIMDSDAFFRPSFVESIIEAFRRDPFQVLHHDEVRNMDRRFYPFNYPAFDEVTGEGCINWTGTTTTGLADTSDPLHTRNYGACMSARRRDLNAIGGADEHIDYLGHICGPYELTWRLVNFNRREVWHEGEFIYHVWHPGQAGDENFGGPHDGRHMSTRALAVRSSGRVLPAVENRAIAMLRKRHTGCNEPETLMAALISPERIRGWVVDKARLDTAVADSWGQTIRLHQIRPERDGQERAGRARVRRRQPLPGLDWVVFRRRPERSEPVLRAATKLRLVPLLALLVLRQWLGLRTDPGVKTPRGGPVRRLRRLALRQRYWMRRCWHRLCVAYLNGADEVAFYGTDGYIRVARVLCRDVPLRLCGVVPDRPTKRERIAGCRVLAEHQVRYVRGYILLTNLRRVKRAYRRLEEMNVPKERVMPLR